MDAAPVLSLPAANATAAPDVPRSPTGGALAVGVFSLREMVEQAVAEAEAHAIRRALASARGNKSLAARLLQTNYTTLHAKMKRFEISAREFRPA
jgi:DNA-binding NtrC family response regulator